MLLRMAFQALVMSVDCRHHVWRLKVEPEPIDTALIDEVGVWPASTSQDQSTVASSEAARGQIAQYIGVAVSMTEPKLRCH